MIESIIQTPDGYRATIDGVEWSIPNDPGNRFFVMVQEAIDAGAQVTVEAPPAPVPNLTFPQLLFGLVTEGFITQQEGNAWLVDRTLPANVEAAISQLPGPQQLLMRARALQPTEVLFSDPMVQSMGAAQGKTQEQMAQFFRTYAAV